MTYSPVNVFFFFHRRLWLPISMTSFFINSLVSTPFHYWVGFPKIMNHSLIIKSNDWYSFCIMCEPTKPLHFPSASDFSFFIQPTLLQLGFWSHTFLILYSLSQRSSIHSPGLSRLLPIEWISKSTFLSSTLPWVPVLHIQSLVEISPLSLQIKKKKINVFEIELLNLGSLLCLQSTQVAFLL